VAVETVDLGLGAHVPEPDRGVPPACGDDVEFGVQRDAVDPGLVSVVVSDVFVGDQIPAPHCFVLACRVDVCVFVRDH
jgi:hypothetical protein